MIKKILLAVLIVIFSNSLAFAIKPCNGFCGYKIGEKLKIENAKYIGESTGQKMYEVKIIKPFMDFNKLLVGVTPNSGIISQIALACLIKDKSYFKKVGAVLESHYEIKEENKEKEIKFAGDKIYYKFPNHRIINLETEERSLGKELKVVLILIDEKLLSLAEEEAKQNTIKNTDTSGLD